MFRILGGMLLAFTVLFAAVLLGVGLPIRNAVRDASERRQALRVRVLLDSGAAIAVREASVRGLASAYEELVREADERGAIAPAGALETAHADVVEVATRLRGHAPADPEERTFVDDRAAAIRELTRQVIKAEPADRPRSGFRPKLAAHPLRRRPPMGTGEADDAGA